MSQLPPLPVSPTRLENLKKEAKRWLKALRAGDAEARTRLLRAYPTAPASPVLRDIQFALAQEHGVENWKALTATCAAPASPVRPTLARYEEMADALLTAFRTGAPAEMERHWNLTWHRRSWQGMRTYVLLNLGRRPDGDISLEDARYLVAREHGFPDWQALTAYLQTPLENESLIAAKPITLLTSAASGKLQPVAQERNWEAVFARIRDQKLTELNADGQMTDVILERLSHLHHMTSLDLSGSKALTDTGLRYLARMPRLQHLNLSGSAITDAGIGVLR